MNFEPSLSKYIDYDYRVPIQEHHSITDYIAVFDLDESFLHTFNGDVSSVEKLKLNDYPDIKKRLYVKSILIRDTEKTQSLYQFWGVLRPGVSDFIPFANMYFRAIIVWTAGIYPYAREMIKELFKGYQGPFFYFSRRNCNIIDGNYTKPLYLIEKKFPEFKVNKMMIIDDRDISFVECPNNGILIPPYEPNANANAIRVNDIALDQLKYWLLTKEVMMAGEVPKMNKKDIFSYDASVYKDQIPKSIVTKYHFKQQIPVKNEVNVIDPYL